MMIGRLLKLWDGPFATWLVHIANALSSRGPFGVLYVFQRSSRYLNVPIRIRSIFV